MTAAAKSLVVEGWRGINHSFALVNQFQLLELSQRPELGLHHVDMPFHFAHWNRTNNGPGFRPPDEARIAAVAPAQPGVQYDWAYRIFSPVALPAPSTARRLAVFAVTEYGLDDTYFTADSDTRLFEDSGGLLITPSHWSRKRILDYGFRPETVHVVPHAASAAYFGPLPPEQIQRQRVDLGLRDDEVVLVNIGAAIWNKGIDVLLKAFALARQKRSDLRLIFKDQRGTYGLSGEDYVQSTLGAAGLLSLDVLNAITLIPTNLSMPQINCIYAVADCYVSPYRAEGFNLPVIEAMTCGTPVIVTEGGATDDFVHGAPHRKIRATLHTNAVVANRHVAAYHEPDLEHLVELLLAVEPKSQLAAAPSAPSQTWASAVDQLLGLLN